MKKIFKTLVAATLISVVALTGCTKSANFSPDDQDKKLAEYAVPSDFISVNELNSKLENGEENLIIIGVINPKSEIIAKDIDGAYLVWRGDYSGKGSEEALSPDLGGFRYSQAQMEELLSKAGATEDSEIVIYSQDEHNDATRFFWQLKVLGQENVRVLDGGINAWVGAGKVTGKATRLADESVKTEYKAPNYDGESTTATIQMVVDAIENPDEWVIIDTRGDGEFNGTETKSGAYGQGGIENAIHINWSNSVDSETLLLDKAGLEELYSAVKGKKVITFCQSGVRSAHTQVVLTSALGFDNVYNYDGSWIEWSYAASSASEGVVDEALRQSVLSHTTNWTDLGKAK